MPTWTSLIIPGLLLLLLAIAWAMHKIARGIGQELRAATLMAGAIVIAMLLGRLVKEMIW